MPDVFPREAPEPRSLLGWDGTAFRVIAVDAAGNVVLAPGGVNLRQFNSVWRFTGSVSGNSGNILLDSPLLLPGDLVVIENGFCQLSAGSANAIFMQIFDGVTGYAVTRESAPVVGAVTKIEGPIVLVAGDVLRFCANGVGPGTTLQCRAVGYYVRT